jgi:hypothetical protein
MVRTSFWIFMTITLAALLLAQTSIAGDHNQVAGILQLIAG